MTARFTAGRWRLPCRLTLVTDGYPSFVAQFAAFSVLRSSALAAMIVLHNACQRFRLLLLNLPVPFVRGFCACQFPFLLPFLPYPKHMPPDVFASIYTQPFTFGLTPATLDYLQLNCCRL